MDVEFKQYTIKFYKIGNKKIIIRFKSNKI